MQKYGHNPNKPKRGCGKCGKRKKRFERKNVKKTISKFPIKKS